MRQEDNDFFVLVAGVLAAVVTIVVWWSWAGGVQPVPGAVSDIATDTSGDPADAEHGDATSAGQDAESEDATETGVGAPAATPVPTASATAEPTPTVAPTPTPVPTATSVLAAVAEDARLGVFASLLSSTGLDQRLSGSGPYTILAPTDDALAEAAADPVVLRLLELDPEVVLAYHIVDGDILVEPPNELMTRSGEFLPSAFGTGDVVQIRPAANGSVHVLDAVRIPPIAFANVLVDLEPILFAPGSAEIAPESFATLDRLVAALSTSGGPLTVEGHTDDTGDVLQNRVLSEDRARAVVNYLVAHGIDDGRLRAEGFGSGRPVADNETEAGRALNRRIEFSSG